jgi:hypothetical protein
VTSWHFGIFLTISRWNFDGDLQCLIKSQETVRFHSFWSYGTTQHKHVTVTSFCLAKHYVKKTYGGWAYGSTSSWARHWSIVTELGKLLQTEDHKCYGATTCVSPSVEDCLWLKYLCLQIARVLEQMCFRVHMSRRNFRRVHLENFAVVPRFAISVRDGLDILPPLSSVHIQNPYRTFSPGCEVVKALCYKAEGRRFETRWGEWIFFNLPHPSGRTRPWGSLSL